MVIKILLRKKGKGEVIFLSGPVNRPPEEGRNSSGSFKEHCRGQVFSLT